MSRKWSPDFAVVSRGVIIFSGFRCDLCAGDNWTRWPDTPSPVTVLCVCIFRLIMTTLWVSISVSSWSRLAIYGCAPMTCLGWPFTTLVNCLVCYGGQGDHIGKGHDVMTWRGKSSGWTEERTIDPPLLSNTVDSWCQANPNPYNCSIYLCAS